MQFQCFYCIVPWMHCICKKNIVFRPLCEIDTRITMLHFFWKGLCHLGDSSTTAKYDLSTANCNLSTAKCMITALGPRSDLSIFHPKTRDRPMRDRRPRDPRLHGRWPGGTAPNRRLGGEWPWPQTAPQGAIVGGAIVAARRGRWPPCGAFRELWGCGGRKVWVTKRSKDNWVFYGVFIPEVYHLDSS